MQGTEPKTILASDDDGYVDSGRKKRDAKDLARRGGSRDISFLCTTLAQRTIMGGVKGAGYHSSAIVQ